MARLVFLEHLRRQDQRHVSLEDPARPNAEPPALRPSTDAARERALDYLELKPGSFTLELTGVSSGGGGEVVANYAFTVARK